MKMFRFGIFILVLLSLCFLPGEAEIELTPKLVYELLSLRIDNVIRETNNLKSEFTETKAVVERIEQKIERIDANVSLMASKVEISEKEKSQFLVTENVQVIKDASKQFIQEKLKTESALLRRMLINEKSNMRQTVETFEEKFKNFQSDVVKHLTLMNDSIGSDVDNLEHSITEYKTVVENQLTLAENEMQNSFNETDMILQEMTAIFENKLNDSEAKIKHVEMVLTGNIDKMSQRISTVNSNLANADSTLNGRLNNAESQYRGLNGRLYNAESKIRTMSSKQERQEDTFSADISSLSNRMAEEEARKVAFSARLTNKQSYYSKKERIVFNNVIYSHGGGYSSSTGIFTAPKSGTYLFTYNIESSSSGKAHVILRVDGRTTTRAVVDKGPNNNGGNAGISYVWKGDKVWVQTASLQNRYYIWPFRTTFNGILID